MFLFFEQGITLLSQITIIKVPKGGFWDSLLSGDPFFWFSGYMGYLWLGIAILFLFAELNTPGLFFFISFAIGSLCASILAFLGYSIVVQCLSALFVSVISFLVMRKYIKQQNLSRVEYGEALSNTDALVGRRGVVVTPIEVDKPGVVKIGGESWRARCDGDMALPAGASVSILRVIGNTVIVQPTGGSNPPTNVGEKDGDV